MADPTTGIDWTRPILWVIGAVTGLLAWVGQRQIARIDAHDEQIEDLKEKTVTKADLDRTEMRITSAIRESGSHLSERIGDAKETARKAHERIDRITERGG